MKYLSILFLSLLIGQTVFIVPVHARPADPERFPSVRPLFPIPPDTEPNIKGNINSDLSESPQEVNSEENGQVTSQENPSMLQSVTKSKSSFIVWTFIVLVLMAFGYWGYRKSR